MKGGEVSAPEIDKDDPSNDQEEGGKSDAEPTLTEMSDSQGDPDAEEMSS